jgi:hypothetical protein
MIFTKKIKKSLNERHIYESIQKMRHFAVTEVFVNQKMVIVCEYTIKIFTFILF